jgi:hypothetical protein
MGGRPPNSVVGGMAGLALLNPPVDIHDKFDQSNGHAYMLLHVGDCAFLVADAKI